MSGAVAADAKPGGVRTCEPVATLLGGSLKIAGYLPFASSAALMVEDVAVPAASFPDCDRFSLPSSNSSVG